MSDPVFSKLGAWAATADAALAHAAGWLLAKVQVAQQELASIEASDPLVAEALTAAEAYANAHGVPVAAVQGVESALLALARKVAAPASPPSASA